MTLQSKGTARAEYAFAEQSLRPIDMHRESKKSGIITAASSNTMILQHPGISEQQGASLQIPLDLKTWLPFSAPVYKISPDPKDYVMIPVIVMPSDLPNRNGVGFPLKELVRFDPEMGMMSYKTWKGMPTYSEHANDDYSQSRGVIADSIMRPLKGFSGNKIWKVLLLLCFDRNKYPEVANRILSGETNSYSMGAWVNRYECSYCNAELGKCAHLSPKQPNKMNLLSNGHLAHRSAIGIKGFECSEVGTPAYISAISDAVKAMS